MNCLGGIPNSKEQNERVQEVVNIVQCTSNQAREALSKNNWHVERAIEHIFNNPNGGSSGGNE